MCGTGMRGGGACGGGVRAAEMRCGSPRNASAEAQEEAAVRRVRRGGASCGRLGMAGRGRRENRTRGPVGKVASRGRAAHGSAPGARRDPAGEGPGPGSPSPHVYVPYGECTCPERPPPREQAPVRSAPADLLLSGPHTAVDRHVADRLLAHMGAGLHCGDSGGVGGTVIPARMMSATVSAWSRSSVGVLGMSAPGSRASTGRRNGPQPPLVTR